VTADVWRKYCGFEKFENRKSLKLGLILLPRSYPVKENIHMNGKWFQSSMARRMFLTRLGVGVGAAGAAAVSSPAAMAQAATAEGTFRPTRYPQDDWYDKIPGVHRYVFDTSSAEGIGWALQFASNYFTASAQTYNLKDSDLAVIIVARHKATSFAYNDAIWAKYGKQLSEQAEYVDPKTKEAPKINVYGPGGETLQAGKMEALIKKGAQFAVCSTSTRGIATRIAKANGTEVDAVVKEITANLIGNARMVPAGVIAVNRAQEHGYSFIFAI
jgi:intracellular sulfur oxidation DsrE/DsrF family protein